MDLRGQGARQAGRQTDRGTVNLLRGALALGLAISCSSEPGEPTSFVESPVLTGCGAASLSVTSSPVTFAPGDRREYIVPSALSGAMGDGRITFTLSGPLDAGVQPPVVVCTYVYGSGGSAPLQACTTTPANAIVAGAGSGLLADSVLLERLGSGGGFGVALSWTKDDRNGCTADACNGNQAPTHTGNPSLAGTVCGVADLCSAPSTCNANGQCVAGQAIDPTDLNPCTADSCDPSTGVKHVFVCIPPGPVATEGNLLVPTNFATSIAALAGNQGAGTAIDPTRAAVLRGRVFDSVVDNQHALSGVSVRALAQPALASTTTSGNGDYTGWYDFVANGGGDVVLVFEKAGYLPVQRHADTRWNDTTVLDDVVMVPENTAGVTVHQNIQTWQRAEGLVSPAEGSTPARKSVVLFPPGWAVTTQSWPGNTGADVTIRSTEYTTGASGPLRMPGDLPPATGYTYASEFVVKEARDANVATVSFPANAPAIGYVQALTPTSPVDGGMPGDPIPVGTYNPTSGFWKGESSGTILQYLGQTNGKADLACGSAGCAAGVDGGTGLGITDGEREQVAQLGYSAGQLLWRFVQPHFSAWDTNWGFGPPALASYPPEMKPTADVAIEDPICRAGSIIECENRILRESIPIAGSPYALHYSSERQDGYRQQITVPLTDGSPPTIPEFKRIEYDVQIAGQRYFGMRPAGTIAKNDRVVISWDRRDGWGRRVQGSVVANIKVGYVYAGVTRSGGAWASALSSGATITGDRAYREIKLYRYFNTKLVIPQMDAKPLGFGGWTFGPDHVLDPATRGIFFGDGSRRNPAADTAVIVNVAGFGSGGIASGDPARGAAISPSAIAVGADGAVYMGGGLGNGMPAAVRRVDPVTGTLSYALGKPTSYSSMYCSAIVDGQPATNFDVSPNALAVGPDGTVYVASDKRMLYRIAPATGFIYRVAGNCSGYMGDLGDIGSVATAQDGSIVFSTNIGGGWCIRKVTPEGAVRTIAGVCGTAASSTSLQSGTAFVPLFNGGTYPVATGRDGAVYVGAYDRLVQIQPSGTMRVLTAAPNGLNSGDGMPASQTALANFVRSVAVAPDGAILVAVHTNLGDIVRRISPASAVSTVVGGSTNPLAEGALAAGSNYQFMLSIAAAPDGTLFWTDGNNAGSAGIRKAKLLSPQSTALVPGPEGTLEFCPDGRLLRTLSPLHGTPLLTFVRGAATSCNQAPDLLTSVTDLVGTIGVSRTSSQVTIQPPNGAPSTVITLDGSGYAQQVSNGVQVWQLTHKTNGLLETLRDPSNRVHSFIYDGAGRLLADKNPLGGTAGTQLDATIEDRKRTVRVTSPEGRLATHVIDTRGVPGTNVFERRTNTVDGVPGSSVTDKARGGTTTTRALDQASATIAETSVTQASDTSRWFMQAPWVKTATEKRGSFSRTVSTTTHTVTLTNGDPRYVAAQSDVWHVSGAPTGKDATASYANGEQVESTWTLKSPERAPSGSENGTETQIAVDEYDRPKTIQRAGTNPTLAPVQITYAGGRVQSVAQAGRTATFGYTGPWLSSVQTTGLGTVTYGNFDGLGRAQKVWLPAAPIQARTLDLQYDAMGNVTSLQLPKGVASTHTFLPNPVDALAQYTPPLLGGATPTAYAYDCDSLLTSFTPPSQSAVSYARDTAGRLTQRSSANATIDLTYEPNTGALASATVQGGVSNAFTYCGSGGTVGPTGLLCRETITGVVPYAGAKTIDYAYDTRMRLAKRTLEGREIGYQYDEDDCLVAITLGTTEILRLAYSSSGFLSTITAEEGTGVHPESYTYADGTGDLTHIGEAALGYSFDYEREAATGRVSRWQEALPGWMTRDRHFTYDAANRLGTVKDGQGTPWQVPWDAHGNFDASDSIRTDTAGTATNYVGSTTFDAQDRIAGGGGWAYWWWNDNGDLATSPRTSATTGARTTSSTIPSETCAPRRGRAGVSATRSMPSTGAFERRRTPRRQKPTCTTRLGAWSRSTTGTAPSSASSSTPRAHTYPIS